MVSKIKKNLNDRYDVIIIGSGIGGLTTASLLAQIERKRVLVLERHFKIGGFTHTFSRQKKYEWDVGLHYVGDVGIGDTARAVSDFITRGKVHWNPMPEVYDRLMFPDFRFDVRAGRENLKADLIERFPHERLSIEQYFKDLNAVNRWLATYAVTQALPKTFRPLSWLARKFGAQLALMKTGEYMNKNFKDPKLKAVLLGQWGLYGLSPKTSAFVGHALLMNHYSNGGYYPVGGSGMIANAITPLVEEYGGQVLVNHSVDEIIIENGKAVGVKVTHKKGRESIKKAFYADVIISNAGAHTTYTQMIPTEQYSKFSEAVRRFPKGSSSVTLYLGLKENPARLGFQGENYWIYSGYDHAQIYSRRNELVEGKVSHAYLSFPSMRNPEARGHTAEIIAFLDIDHFVEWENKPWRKRGEEYEELKRKISHALISFVEERFPGFGELIDYQELGTPITTKYFTNHHNGNMYGLPMVPEKFTSTWLGPHTPVRNLYLTGADAAFFGIVGAMMSGVLASAVAMGRPWRVMSILSEADRFSRQLHANEASGSNATENSHSPTSFWEQYCRSNWR